MIMIKSQQFTALRSTTEWGNITKVADAIYQVIAFIHKTIPVILDLNLRNEQEK